MIVEGFNYPRFQGKEDTALSAGKKEIVVEKSDIKALPEGMSSEALDALTTGEEIEEKDDLAGEALEAAEEPSPAEESVETEEETEAEDETEKKPEDETEEKPEVDPKDAVIGDFRRKNRDLEIDKAKLEGELKARSELAAPKVEKPKSPLEIAEAAYIEEFGELKGFAMNGELYRQQTAFDDKLRQEETETEKKQQTNTSLTTAAETLQENELSVEKMGQGLDYQSLSKIGDKYITKGDGVDLADIQAKKGTKAALKEAYSIMRRRVLAAGNEDSKALRLAINAKKKGKPQTKPKTGTDIDALTTEGEDEDTGEAENETHSSRLTKFIFSPD